MSATTFQTSYAGNNLAAANKGWRSYAAELARNGNTAIGQPVQLNFDTRPYRSSASKIAAEQPIRPELQESVYALAKLPLGWDGYLGLPSPRNAILDGVAFIHHIPTDWPDPQISVGGSGAFSFYWREDESVADIEFDGTGTLAAYLASNGELILSEIVPITGKEIQEKLVEPLRRLLVLEE